MYAEGWNAWAPLRDHIGHGLASTVNELALFLSAGVLAAGLIGVTRQLDGWLPIRALRTVAGQPAAAGHDRYRRAGGASGHQHRRLRGLAGALHPEPNLLAITLLMAWGIGVPANPLSGLHLMMQGRYRIDGYAFLRWNAGYVLTSVWAWESRCCIYMGCCWALRIEEITEDSEYYGLRFS